MFHVLYKTTNNLNGRFYVGVHSTDNLFDDYLGTGRSMLNAIAKHGRENFARRIIAVFPTRELAMEAEAKIVNQAFVDDPRTYNIALGGIGGAPHTEEAKKAMSEKRMGNQYAKGARHSAEANRQKSERNKMRDPAIYVKMGESMKGNQNGNKPITIDGITFPSRKAAGEYFGVGKSTIQSWKKWGKGKTEPNRRAKKRLCEQSHTLQ